MLEIKNQSMEKIQINVNRLVLGNQHQKSLQYYHLKTSRFCNIKN